MDANAKRIRYLRKKLRQIDALENRRGDYTQEERYKLQLKESLYDELMSFDMILTNSERTDDVYKTSNEQQSSLPDVHPHEVSEVYESVSTVISSSSSSSDVKKISTVISPPPMDESKKQQSTFTKRILSSTSSSSSSNRRNPTCSSLIEQNWLDGRFYTHKLCGHSGNVTSVKLWSQVVDGVIEERILSGGEDTTVRVWQKDSSHSWTELQCFGGHTGAVNSVDVSKEKDIVSCSEDCSINVWCLTKRAPRLTIYTYAPVKAISCRRDIIASASESGKLELWNLGTGDRLWSTIPFVTAITCASVGIYDRLLFAGAGNGVVRAWLVPAVGDCSDTFTPEETNIAETSSHPLSAYPTSCLVVTASKVLWGGLGRNIRFLDINTSEVKKVTNYRTSSGPTQAATVNSIVLAVSGWDDTSGYINVTSLVDLTTTYRLDLPSDQLGRVLSLDMNDDYMVSAGSSGIYVWEVQSVKMKSTESIIRGRPLREVKSIVDTSDDEDSDEDEGEYKDSGKFWKANDSKETHETWWPCKLL